MQATDIKSMKLYWNAGRIYNELSAAGIDRKSTLRAAELNPFDQYHYHGTAAVDTAIEYMGLGENCHVLDVGSGIGGPARYMAETLGCRTTALELQPDLNALAEELTKRCGLSGLIKHACGDALDFPLTPGRFDAVVSWLALYHIADHPRLFAGLFSALKSPGGLYVEDLCCRGTFSPKEEELLDVELYSRRLVTADEYHDELTEAGFRDIQIEDMSQDWTRFTQQRLRAYRSDRKRHLSVHGKEIVEAQDSFFETVVLLFQAGNLGGLRILAKKI
jgi:cyclopropane fatty-acyl-phospholipid synthase-like methyltransferase